MATVTIDSYAIVFGLFLMGVVNGIASAIGNIIAQRYVKPHIVKRRL